MPNISEHEKSGGGGIDANKKPEYALQAHSVLFAPADPLKINDLSGRTSTCSQNGLFAMFGASM